ncbi:unnamed protein product, partial [Prorocentrum cordatum]
GRVSGGEEAAADGRGEGAEMRRLALLMAKLLVQREDTNRGNARDDNFTVTLLRKEGQMQRWASAGNALGKHPDVYMKQLVFRLHKAAQLAGQNVTDAAKQGAAAYQVKLGFDHAARCKTAKAVEIIAFKTRKAQPQGQGKKKTKEQ